MRSGPEPTPPALLRDHEAEIHELGHIATLLRTVTDEGGPIPTDLTNAVSFLTYLAIDRVEILRKALSGVQT